jgi:hypothetical protein
MLRHAIAVIAVSFMSTQSAHAHTIDRLHPHPHSMDAFAVDGVATLALMLAAFGLLLIARQCVSSKRKPINTHRGRQ